MRAAEFRLWSLCALMLAGVIHLSLVLALPLLAADELWQKMGLFGPNGRFNTLTPAQAEALPLRFSDPMMVYAVCRFDLSAGPVRISAVLDSRYWSLAIYSRSGDNVYSINNRTAGGASLDITLTSPTLQAVSQELFDSLEDDRRLAIEPADPLGFAILRSFVAAPSLRRSIENNMRGALCEDAMS